MRGTWDVQTCTCVSDLTHSCRQRVRWEKDDRIRVINNCRGSTRKHDTQHWSYRLYERYGNCHCADKRHLRNVHLYIYRLAILDICYPKTCFFSFSLFNLVILLVSQWQTRNTCRYHCSQRSYECDIPCSVSKVDCCWRTNIKAIHINYTINYTLLAEIWTLNWVYTFIRRSYRAYTTSILYTKA